MRRGARNLTVVAIAAVTGLAGGAAASEVRSAGDDQQAMAVTIYNDDLALVKDTRRVRLQQGTNQLALREVSAKIRPETAQLRSTSHPGAIRLVEQNFDFDLLTPAKLLEKFVGRSVRVVRTHPTTGVETEERAEVLAAAQGVVLRMGSRIETGLPGRIVYDSVPETLRDRPTLAVTLENSAAASQNLELSYLTGGLQWRADYVAELNDTDTALGINGWVTLTNQSGAAYRDARVQLVAGDVNRVREDRRTLRHAVPMAAEKSAYAVQQEALFEYHLYSLPATLAVQLIC